MSKIMIKKLLFGYLMFQSFIVFSQKTVVALLPLEHTQTQQNEAVAITEKIKQAFIATNRFEIVDRTNLSKINSEKELQKTEAFMNSAVVAQDNSKAAQQLVSGRIVNVSYQKMLTEKSYYFNCNVSFTLDVIDVETGELIHSATITPKDSFMGGVLSSSLGGNSTPEAAFKNALGRMQKYINEFIESYFPITTYIIEIVEVKKDEAKSLLLNVGTIEGAKKKDSYNVYEITHVEVNGKKIKRELLIGNLKIEDVQGNEISLAKVVKGGQAILEKFKSNATIHCKSTL